MEALLRLNNPITAGQDKGPNLYLVHNLRWSLPEQAPLPTLLPFFLKPCRVERLSPVPLEN
jgi:hypothetical protein